MNIGITGQNGFVGSHLYNTLNLDESVTLIPFDRSFMSNEAELQNFVKQCDCIVHLAAMNRHEDQQVIYDTNLSLVNRLIDACAATDSKPHIVFSSSTQEEKDNLYGKSKKEGAALFQSWAKTKGAKFSQLVIPNVFGPFGKPFYNSVVATFCHQVANGETPTIINDAELNLIYINELVADFIDVIKTSKTGRIAIEARHSYKVSEILNRLLNYKESYMEAGKFPYLDQSFDLALFNMFRCYIPTDFYPRPYTKHTDPRGSFVEIARTETSGQFSFSTTVPGITRGNHFHTRKAERFAVIKGKAKIQLRKVDTDEVIDYIIDGSEPAYVDMPIWYTHNITNIGDDELITLFWINEPYNQEDADTYFVDVVEA